VSMTCHCCSGRCRKSGTYRNRNRVVQRYACDRCGKSFSEEQPLQGMRVDFDKACQVVHLLCESMGIRAIERLTGLSRPTVLSILEVAGEKANAFLEDRLRCVQAPLVEADEIHSFVQCKQQMVEDGDTERGEQYTFLSMAKDSKLIINWLVGKRTRENAVEFLMGLKRRMVGNFQLTTDNWHIYSGEFGSVWEVFGHWIDYAVETKYFASPTPVLPRRLIGIRRRPRIGNPDMDLATTCHAERTNLTLRTFTRRLTRCTLGYSKKLDNLKHAVALFMWYYDFCRIHSAHGKTPAVAAGVAKKVWTIRELLY